MTIAKIESKLKKMFCEYFFEKPESLKRLKGGVSDRMVYRIKSKNYVCIGIHNAKIKENIAFVEFSKSLKSAGIAVPEVYYFSEDKEFYLEENAGEKSIYDISREKRTRKKEKLDLYKKAIEDLVKIQIKGNKVINYKYCCETKVFDKKQVLFDFNKFYTYYLLKLTDIKLSRNEVSEIKKEILKVILNEKKLFFMYRDFQPRNIMVKDGDLYYIDFQSGRKGALQYDIASFLYSGSIMLDGKERKNLLNYYINNLPVKINRNKFIESFYFFAFIRLLQVLGSYGFTYFKTGDKNILKKSETALINLKSIKNKIENKNFRLLIGELISHPVKP